MLVVVAVWLVFMLGVAGVVVDVCYDGLVVLPVFMIKQLVMVWMWCCLRCLLPTEN